MKFVLWSYFVQCFYAHAVSVCVFMTGVHNICVQSVCVYMVHGIVSTKCVCTVCHVHRTSIIQ